MDQEIVVKEALTPDMITAGAQLLRVLDNQGWPVTAALWFYQSGSNRWRLFIASPEVGKAGAFKAYAQIRLAKAQMAQGADELEAHSITVLDPSEEPVSLLLPLVRTAPGGIGGMRVSRTGINARYIDDAYVYRLA